MINFQISIEELPDTHVKIAIVSSQAQSCTRGELQCFKKILRFLDKEFRSQQMENIVKMVEDIETKEKEK